MDERGFSKLEVPLGPIRMGMYALASIREKEGNLVLARGFGP